MASRHNIFTLLEEVQDDRTTNNFIRKVKKKLREIESLKQKEYPTEEEKAKITTEKYWKSMIPSKKKLFTKNKFDICAVYHKQHEPYMDDCPICLNPIAKNMGVITNCNHIYCHRCVSDFIIRKTNWFSCSLCRTVITNYAFHDEDTMIDIMNLLAFTK